MHIRPIHPGFLPILGAFLAVSVLFSVPLSTGWAADCPTFFLKTDTGEIIDPINGKNANQPYSTRQTCGACHDYEQISKGYHFQMGWDRVRDDFSQVEPWRLSPGMTGGF